MAKRPWTPGPWTVENDDEGKAEHWAWWTYIRGPEHSDGYRPAVATLNAGDEFDPDFASVAADARLIAAAPELAELLAAMFDADDISIEPETLTATYVLLKRLGFDPQPLPASLMPVTEVGDDA